MLPLLAAAIVAGAVRTGAGLLSNKGEYQRGRDFINASSANAKKRLKTRQADTREDTNESLIARGLTAGGQAPGTIAGGTRTNLESEFGLEQRDLDLQTEKALGDNKASYNNGIIGAITSGAQTGMSIYGMGASMGAGAGAAAGSAGSAAASDALQLAGDGGSTAIQTAMTAGVQHPSNWWGGISGLDPLNAPGSSWNRNPAPSESGGGVALGMGQSNSEFHV